MADRSGAGGHSRRGIRVPGAGYFYTDPSLAERKRILRFIVREVTLDGKRIKGQVWLKILWQTEAVSEHRIQRFIHAYADHAEPGATVSRRFSIRRAF